MHHQEVAVLAVKGAQLIVYTPHHHHHHLPPPSTSTSTAGALISILKTQGIIFLRAVYLLFVFQSASRHRPRTAPRRCEQDIKIPPLPSPPTPTPPLCRNERGESRQTHVALARPDSSSAG